MKKSRLILVISILLISLLHYFMDDDFYKLMLSGKSSTYGTILVRNHLLGLVSAIVLLGIFIFVKRGNVKTYTLIFFLIVWGISLKTKLIDCEQKKCLHGILFVKIYETKYIDDCP